MTEESRKRNPKVMESLHNLVRKNNSSNEKTHRRTTETSNINGKNCLTSKPLLDCIDIFSLKKRGGFRKSFGKKQQHTKTLDEPTNDEQVNPGDPFSTQSDFSWSITDICVPTTEHLSRLQITFNKALHEHSLSNDHLKNFQLIFMKLRELITKEREDYQVNLYGSMYFECCLKTSAIMDIDVQFKDVSSYNTLKLISEVIKNDQFYTVCGIDKENVPICLNLITSDPKVHVRITSQFSRGIHLSKLLRIYIQFDKRVIKLFRLFRILSKICQTDKPGIGTLHPTVFHIMVIHFLQQVEPPVLPCLHEYVYGIDNVPLTLSDSSYPKFFETCKNYCSQWKSTNTTCTELLFLQILSYYLKTFNAKQFVVSIQTRMPVIKRDKGWHSKKLLIEDPMDTRRNLNHTMQSQSSINYFRETLTASLNYFGRKTTPVTPTSISDPIVKISVINDDEDLKVESTNLLHNSYTLFYKRLPSSVARDSTMKQVRVRDHYKRTFNDKTDSLSKGIIQLKSIDGVDDNDVGEIFEDDDIERSDGEIDAFHETHDEATVDDLFQSSSNDDQETLHSKHDASIVNSDDHSVQSTPEESKENLLYTSTTNELLNPVTSASAEETLLTNNTEKLSPLLLITTTTSDKNCSDNFDDCLLPFISPIQLEDVLSSDTITIEDDNSADVSSDFCYDFRPENFHAEQGPPYVCSTCNGIGHTRSECPELCIPAITDLPLLSKQWENVLSKLCQTLAQRLKPDQNDIKQRELILNDLEQQIRKLYPGCQLHAFGSFYNGFGFRKSDLDVCMVFNDGNDKHSTGTKNIMGDVFRVMKTCKAYTDVQPILNAKVPIIKSKHRKSNVEIDVSLHNMLAIENTRLLKTYAELDPRVSELGYMIKHLAKTCSIGDASRGTLSSYAYIIMLIHFLQQVNPPILPVLQQFSDDPTRKQRMFKPCAKWNTYFYDNINILKELWKTKNESSSGFLWLELLRYYTEVFNINEHVVTIRQFEPLLKDEKGWFKRTIAIEDPFELSHNLAAGLSPRNWTMIRRVFSVARSHFGIQHEYLDSMESNMPMIEETLFNVYELCPANAPARCEWCKGKHHPRRYCPYFASMRTEEDNKNENASYKVNKNQDCNNVNKIPRKDRYNKGPYSNKDSNRSDISANAHVDQTFSPNCNSAKYHENNGLNNNTEERPMLGFSQNEQNIYNHSRAQRNNRQPKCFVCGSIDHLRANCPKHGKQKNTQ